MSILHIVANVPFVTFYSTSMFLFTIIYAPSHILITLSGLSNLSNLD